MIKVLDISIDTPGWILSIKITSRGVVVGIMIFVIFLNVISVLSRFYPALYTMSILTRGGTPRFLVLASTLESILVHLESLHHRVCRALLPRARSKGVYMKDSSSPIQSRARIGGTRVLYSRRCGGTVRPEVHYL